ncbi:MAG: TetR/AcrR family transcriptional regulator [Solirubrobacteraceae bacterium]
MVTPNPEHVRHRRRGPQLESALLDAAWDELVEVGFANLTMESVAARGHTGIAVLYRRWANKQELVLAAIAHYGHAHPVETPDTGTLRGDLLALLTAFSDARSTFIAVLAAAGFSGLLADTGLTPAQAREQLLGDQRIRSDQIIYQRAHDRGEITLDHVPPAVLSMPFDLVRHDLLMSLNPLRPKRIHSIIDELFLPLLHGYQSPPTSTRASTTRSASRQSTLPASQARLHPITSGDKTPAHSRQSGQSGGNARDVGPASSHPYPRS